MNQDMLLELMEQPKKIYTDEELQFAYLSELIPEGLEFNENDYTFRLPQTDERYNDSFTIKSTWHNADEEFAKTIAVI